LQDYKKKQLMQSLETETEILRDRDIDETWDIRDRDSKKTVSRRPSLETPSLLFRPVALQQEWIRGGGDCPS